MKLRSRLTRNFAIAGLLFSPLAAALPALAVRPPTGMLDLFPNSYE